MPIMTPLLIGELTLHITSASFETGNRKVLSFETKRDDETPVMVHRQSVHRMSMTWTQDPHTEAFGWGQRRPTATTSWDAFTPKAWQAIAGTVQAWFLTNDGFHTVFDEAFRTAQRCKSPGAINYDALRDRYRRLGEYVDSSARLAEGLGAGLYSIRPTPNVDRSFHTPRMSFPDRPHECEAVTAAIWEGDVQVGWILQRSLPVPMKDYNRDR
jgi:hypothetical protein